MRSFFITLIQTITTISGIEFILLPYIFVSTGIVYPFIILIGCVLSLLSIFIYRKAQTKLGLFGIHELSQHCGGKQIQSISLLMNIGYNILVLSVLFIIVSDSIEQIVLSETEVLSDQWWKSEPVIKAMIITILIPLLAFIPLNKLIGDICSFSSFLLPIVYLSHLIYAICALTKKETIPEIVIGRDIMTNLGLHHFLPTFSFIVCIFAPFKSKIN